jgi:hypothetical protein
MKTDPELDYAFRFRWWWRVVFQAPAPTVSMVEALQPFIRATQHLLGENPPAPETSRCPESQSECAPEFPINPRLYGILNQRRERSAFLYELGGRVTGKFEFGFAWIELDEAHKAELEQRWPQPGERIVCEKLTRGETEHDGHVQLPVSCWNLKMSDETLNAKFQEFITHQRDTLGIPNPKRSEGRGRRPLSWRPVELMDLRTHTGYVLNDSERSSVSKAVRLYEGSI